MAAERRFPFGGFFFNLGKAAGGGGGEFGCWAGLLFAPFFPIHPCCLRRGGGGGEGVELGLSAGFAFGPFSPDPALLLKTVESGVERALLDLENFARKLLNPLANRPSMERFKSEGLQYKEIEGSLNEIAWLSHA